MSGSEGPPRTAALIQTHDHPYRIAVPGSKGIARMGISARGDGVVRLVTVRHGRFVSADLSAHGSPADVGRAFVPVSFRDKSGAPTRRPIDRAAVGALPGQLLDEYVVCAPTRTGEE